MDEPNFHKAAHLLAEWIRSNGRFDLRDVADRSKCLPQLNFLIEEVYALLLDDLNNDELEIFYEAQVKDTPNWFIRQLSKIFRNS